MGKQPHLLVDEGEVHDIALLPGDPDRVQRIADRCDRHERVSQNREYQVTNAEIADQPITICSTGIGSPSAAIAMEELCRLGVGTFIRVGTCGALQADIDVGEYVIATAAAKEEGTTKRYERATYPAVADPEVLDQLITVADEHDAGARYGPIVTDDAFYAETPSYVEDWEGANLLAIEMEAAAIFTLARRYGRRAGAICTVDGNLVRGTQKGETEDEQELPDASDAAIDSAIDIALESARRL